ncbi:MAG: amidohydrolase [Actinobacteria bacterium]|nr:amidohydrolase [Actinomycetota bacterium]
MSSGPLPMIVSVDDHIIEPPDLWISRFPSKLADQAPRVERRNIVSTRMVGAGIYELIEGDEGRPADCWIYDDKVIYVHKSHVAIPNWAVPGGDITKFDKSKMDLTCITYDDMWIGCTDPQARIRDLEAAGVEASLGFPTAVRFCGQVFLEASDKEVALLGVQAYNDWMVEEWCGPYGNRNVPLCIVPLWDVELAAAEIRRNAARGVRAVAFSELPIHLGLPSIHSGYWDPFFEACNETKTTVCMHIGSSSKMLATSDDAPIAVTATLTFNNAMASLSDYLFSGLFPRFPNLRVAYSEGQIGWLPYVLERADDVWETHEGWMHTRKLVPEPPSTYYADHVFGCFFRDNHGIESIHKVGVNNVTYETDYPHTDTTWPHTHEYVEKVLANVPDEIVHKILRGNALDMLSLDEDLHLVN